MKKFTKAVLDKAVSSALKTSENSTTCSNIYQPKAPAALKKFSRVENDK